MATPQVTIPKPLCQLCEIVYDRNDRVPRVFPCQHTLCSSCLHARIKNCTRTHTQQLDCPFCSQTTPLKDTLPVNQALLDLLGLMQDLPTLDAPADIPIKGQGPNQGQGESPSPSQGQGHGAGMTSHDERQYLPTGISLNPESVNTKIGSLLASAHLPDFKHIDLNRRNKLLLVFPNAKHAIYKIHGSGFSQMNIPKLCEKSSCALKEADYVLLSDENGIVIPSECFVMHDNTTHAFHYRFPPRILYVTWDRFIAAIEEDGRDGFVTNIGYITEDGVKTRPLYQFKHDTEYIVMTSDERPGFLLYSDGKIRNIELLPVPRTVIAGAAIGNKVFIVEKDKPSIISVYIVEDRCKTEGGQIIERSKDGWLSKRERSYETADNKLMSVSMNDLGLSERCEIVRIWAGDEPRRQGILHVLYKSSVQYQEGIKQHAQDLRQQHGLASYTLSQELLDLK